MRTIQMYEKDDVVKVIDKNYRYSTYKRLFEFFNIESKDIYYDNLKEGFKSLKNGYFYTVIRQVSHAYDSDLQLLFIKDKSGYIYIIGVEGVELYTPPVELWA